MKPRGIARLVTLPQQQAAIPELDDITSATLYLDTEGCPEREYTASTTSLF